MIALKHYLSRLTWLTTVVITAFIMQGCPGDPEESGPARLVISLVDSPADYEAVNVDIQEISLKTSGAEEDDGWIMLDGFTPGVYNILQYTGGNELKLANMKFPPGNISQIRLKLGQDNTLISKNYNSKLVVPSGSSSGLKFNVNVNIAGGQTNNLKIDFDAARSIVKLGSTGQFVLKPVIKIFSVNTTGTITGKVMPADENVLINIIRNNQIIASSYAPKNASKFLVPGVDAGIYKMSFEISEGGYQKIIDKVTVANGQVTDIGTIQMNE